MLTRLIPVATALILGSLSLSEAHARTITDSGTVSCSFNQHVEECEINFFEDLDREIRLYRVKWLSDGKEVTYLMSDCWTGKNNHGMCHVRITEDNGQVSQGVAELGCVGPSIRSEHGNFTYLRFIPNRF